jgi:hypothetical protein
MMEAARTSETSVDNHFTRQYNPEDSSEHSTYIHYLTAVIFTTSGKVKRHSSSFKMATVLKECTKEEVRSLIRFYGRKRLFDARDQDC